MANVKKGFDKINEKCKTSQIYVLLLKIFKMGLSQTELYLKDKWIGCECEKSPHFHSEQGSGSIPDLLK